MKAVYSDPGQPLETRGGESVGMVYPPAKQRISCKTARTPQTLSPHPATVSVFAPPVSGFLLAPRRRRWVRQPAAPSQTRCTLVLRTRLPGGAGPMCALYNHGNWRTTQAPCPSQSWHRARRRGNAFAPFYHGTTVAHQEGRVPITIMAP